MQEECKEIYPAVLVNSLWGQEAKRQWNNINNPFAGKVYGPQLQDKGKGKGNEILVNAAEIHCGVCVSSLCHFHQTNLSFSQSVFMEFYKNVGIQE